MVTAYDAPGARMVADGGADLILVGDSARHGRARLRRHPPGHRRRHGPPHRGGRPGPGARGQPDPDAAPAGPLVVGDLPWLSYHVGRRGHRAQRRRPGPGRRPGREARGRRQAGPRRRGHRRRRDPGDGPPRPHPAVGARHGRLQGPGQADRGGAARSSQDAKALEAAGCFAIVLEGVPDQVAAMVTAAVDVPTIGIGAGPRLRRPGARVPRRARPRGPHGAEVRAPLRRPAGRRRRRPCAAFAADVRSGAFPSDAETYHLSDDVAEELALYGG